MDAAAGKYFCPPAALCLGRKARRALNRTPVPIEKTSKI
jgi:hypothetical protein